MDKKIDNKNKLNPKKNVGKNKKTTKILPKKKIVKKAEPKKLDENLIEPIDAKIDMGKTSEYRTIDDDIMAKNKGRRVTIKKKKSKKIGWKIFRILIFVMIALGIIGCGIAVGVFTGIVEDTSQVTLEDFALNENSIMYSTDGQQIAVLRGEENRDIIKYSDLPKYVIDAVISIEDERFYEHNGVDIKRTAAAIFTFVINFGKSDFGGSTITQQLVKNTTQDKDASWTRKVREWYRAVSLEKIMTKEEIMTQYLNTIFMGENSYGVEVASETYFGKKVKDVNIAEAACLAAIIQQPSSYNPYNGEESREALIQRQKVVLSQMLKLGKITQEEYDEAMAYKLEFTKDFKDDDQVSTLSYFADAVINEVVADLAESRGITKVAAENLLYTAGYRIYTTQDLRVQEAIDNAYNNDKLFYYESNGDFMDSSMVVMEQSTGNVVGLIGSALPKKSDRTWNGATQSKHQPGSTMKLLGAYGPAFELGLASPATGVDDSYFRLGDWAPGNYYNGFNGYVTCREAIARSMNIPALRTTQKAGTDYAWTFARNCGLKSLVEQDKNLSSISIGGLTYGVSVLEMCNAYATIANGGVYVEPKLYTKVTDRDGNVILEKKSEVKRVMKDSTAYMLTSCLQSVVNGQTAYGGTAYGYVNVNGISSAGKTGNTDGDRDQWFCGFTPYYTIACWNGYENLDRAIGSRWYLYTYPYTSIVLFNNVMNAICEGKPGADFDRPSSVITAEVCRTSGLVATEACKNDIRGSQVHTDLFAQGTVPTATCTIHKTVSICNVTGKLAGPNCKDVAEKSFITRDDTKIPIKTNDWWAMMPEETCDTCKKEVIKPPTIKPSEEPSGSEVEIY